MRRPLVCVAFAVVGALSVTACSGDSGDAEPVSSAPVDVDTIATDETVDRDDGDAPVVASPTTDVAAGPDVAASTTIAVVPDTGVPGIDSDDAFCRAWSEFAGSFQLLGLVSAVGDPDDARRLEVLAAPTILDAVAALDEHLPATLVDERDAFVDAFAGPMARRALVATGELTRVGIDPAALEEAWLEGLVAAGVDDPAPSISLPTDVDAVAFADAVDATAELLVPIVEDLDLVTDVDVSATLAYIDETCPDQGTLGGNDIVD